MVGLIRSWSEKSEFGSIKWNCIWSLSDGNIIYFNSALYLRRQHAAECLCCQWPTKCSDFSLENQHPALRYEQLCHSERYFYAKMLSFSSQSHGMFDENRQKLDVHTYTVEHECICPHILASMYTGINCHAWQKKQSQDTLRHFYTGHISHCTRKCLHKVTDTLSREEKNSDLAYLWR